MSENKQRLFIYDRKEVAVLISLALMLTVFAFTLGLHLGKRVVTKTIHTGAPPLEQAETVPDGIPNRQELTEQGKNAPEAVDEALDQALHNEVARTGIKMESPRQVELPKEPKAAAAPKAPAKRLSGDTIRAASRKAPDGRYTLQIGSYPSLEVAREQVEQLESAGIQPILRSIDLKEKGTWYRIYLGGFSTKDEAQQAGSKFRTDKVIKSFVVSNMIE